jgi:hypothetical protein
MCSLDYDEADSYLDGKHVRIYSAKNLFHFANLREQLSTAAIRNNGTSTCVLFCRKMPALKYLSARVTMLQTANEGQEFVRNTFACDGLSQESHTGDDMRSVRGFAPDTAFRSRKHA